MDHGDIRQLDRLTFFSDAVFAIAMTLLVVDVRLPDMPIRSDADLVRALVALTPRYIGFLVSFLALGQFWMAHHRLFGMLRRADAGLIRANLCLLLAVAFMPFPTAVLSGYAYLRPAVLLYGAWLMLLGILHAWIARIALGALGTDAARAFRRESWTPILIGMATLAAGAVKPLLALVPLIVGGPLFGLALRRFRPEPRAKPSPSRRPGRS